MKIYCDSSLKEYCLVFRPCLDGVKMIRLPHSEPVTVNVGEYKAVIWALTEAKRLKLEQVLLLTDSLLVVKQVNGLWKCRKLHLIPLRNQVRELIGELTGGGATVRLEWVSRNYNIAGFLLP